MALEARKFTVGAGPHWRSSSSITRMNYAFILALLPTGLVGSIAYAFGPVAAEMDAAAGPFSGLVQILVKEMGVNTGVLWLFGCFGIMALGMGTGVLAEYACQVIMRQPYHAVNGHGALMGLIMALLMPPSVPWWVLVIGVVVAIVVGKQIFGGIGGYPMHPSMVGWLVLLLSWPNHLYPVGMSSIAATHVSCVAATCMGGMALVALGHIRWQITAGVILGVVLSSLVIKGNLSGGVYAQLISGHVILAAFFLAPDSTSSPVNKAAMWIYGAGIGILIILIRAYGIWPDAVPFAVLLMNVLSPLLDRLRPKVKGLKVKGLKKKGLKKKGVRIPNG